MVNDFIFELGCEELPSAAVWPLADELANQLMAALDKAQLSYSEVKRFATPRRLAVIIKDLQAEQKSQRITRRGPAVAVAYDKEGKPTQALLGFAKSCAVTLDSMSTVTTDKGDWIVCEIENAGTCTKELLPTLVSDCLAALPIAKPMRWGNGDAEFARPVHWAVMIYGNEVLEHTLLGIKTGAYSRGHRFHHPDAIPIKSAKEYENQLNECFVIADFSKRRQIIEEQIQQLALSKQALAVMPDDLLNEVTSIVEWPQALLAHFENEFLEVPAEALIASMQSHQKCFALKDSQNHLLPYFITVANIASSNPEQVLVGNEKVMRARLSDAAFFYKQDKKNPLSSYIPSTARVLFQNKLGSLQDKALRIKTLMLHLSQELHLSTQLAERAALLSKCDLLSGMVGEFPELQGLMGYYYALNDGEPEEVAHALNEQYMPRFAGDQLPDHDLGWALSLADRLDTLAGIFAIGQKPSGVKDPFKLRRNALAVVRLLINKPVALNLTDLLNKALTNFQEFLSFDKNIIEELKLFLLERLNSYYQSLEVTTDLVLAVRARQEECLFDLDRRVHALKLFITIPEAAALSAACKRVSNLLSQAPKEKLTQTVNEALITEAEEEFLYSRILQVSQSLEPLYQDANYGAILKQLASLKEPIDAFFDKVMIMVDDELVRTNRLVILAQLRQLLQGVADISLLQL